jgi:hypothetical protein
LDHNTPLTIISNAKLISDPRVFSEMRNNFADWWRSMKLFLSVNKVTNPNEKIIIMTHKMKGGIAGFYARSWEEKLL